MKHMKATMNKRIISLAMVILLAALFFQEAAFGNQETSDWVRLYTSNSLCYVGTDQTVTIPPNVTTLDEFAFYGCGSVKTIIIPKTVKYITDYSIYNVPNLINIIFYGNPVIEKEGIYFCPRLRSISCPRERTHPYSFAVRMHIAAKVGYQIGFPKNTVYLLKGDKCQQVLCNTIDTPITWKSSKKAVAAVDSKGVVKAKKTGKAKITAVTRNGRKYSYNVQVYKKTVSERVKQIKKSEAIKEKNKFERVKAVHAWMVSNIRYDYSHYLKNKLPRSAYTVKGALLKKLCVCMGYALAFKKLMKAYHIPCKVVRGKAGGEGHAWNMVKLSGKWYHVDVTWDDPIVNGRNNNKEVRYEYFLKSTKYMKSHSHSFRTKSYPKCTSRKYDNQFVF